MSRRWRSTRRARCGDTLRAHGWDDGQAAAAAGGIHPLAFHLTGLDQDALEALVRLSRVPSASRSLTGDGWAVLVRQPIPPQRLRPAVAGAARARRSWRSRSAWPCPPSRRPCGRRPAEPVALDRPVLMGILNVTPDSFSDGGRYTALDAALAHADALLEAGADDRRRRRRIDAARPRRAGTAEDVELARVVPVVEALVRAPPRAAALGRHGEVRGRPRGARTRAPPRERRLGAPARSRRSARSWRRPRARAWC